MEGSPRLPDARSWGVVDNFTLEDCPDWPMLITDAGILGEELLPLAEK